MNTFETNLYSTFVTFPTKILFAVLIHLSTYLLLPAGSNLTKMGDPYFRSWWKFSFRFVSFRFVSWPVRLLPTHSRCQGYVFSLDHTQTHTTVGRTSLDKGSARCRDLYLTTQTCTRDKHPCFPVGFEPTVPASARLQTYASDRAATDRRSMPQTARPLGSAMMKVKR
jgi:hypothetical protein